MSIAAFRACARRERLWPKAYGMHLLNAWFMLKGTFAMSLIGMVEAGQKIAPSHLKVALVASVAAALCILALTVVCDWINRVRRRYRTYRRAPRHRSARLPPAPTSPVTRTVAAD